jgi:hypothetical protein
MLIGSDVNNAGTPAARITERNRSCRLRSNLSLFNNST